MNVLITGAAGFVGRNLTEALKAIRDGKDRRFPDLSIGELYLYDINSPESLLEEGERWLSGMAKHLARQAAGRYGI